MYLVYISLKFSILQLPQSISFHFAETKYFNTIYILFCTNISSKNAENITKRKLFYTQYVSGYIEKKKYFSLLQQWGDRAQTFFFQFFYWQTFRVFLPARPNFRRSQIVPKNDLPYLYVVVYECVKIAWAAKKWPKIVFLKFRKNYNKNGM